MDKHAAMSTVGVYIGRFQPFHNGHKSIVDRMIAECDESILIIGSAFSPRSENNPFDLDEREDMLLAEYMNSEWPTFWAARDNPDDSLWAEDIKARVNSFATKDRTVALYGARSDASSFYLDMFPEWELRLTEIDPLAVHATDIREMIRENNWELVRHYIPVGTYEYLKQLVETEPDTCHRWLR